MSLETGAAARTVVRSPTRGRARAGGRGRARPCTRCGEEVWIDQPVLELAESCTGVVCCDCTGTAHGILLIPSG